MDTRADQEFTHPDDLSDVCLIVEDQKLYANKIVLATASPVFKRMFLSDFREKKEKEVPLPGKKYDDILELLKCIYPSVRKPVYDKNVLQLLPLADEYQMVRLKNECEDLLLSKLLHDAPEKQFMQYLIEAQRYGLDRLLEKACRLAATLSLNALEQRPEYGSIEQETYVKILRCRVRNLEKHNASQLANAELWMARAEHVEQQLTKSEVDRQRQNDQFALNLKQLTKQAEAMKNAWDLRGPDSRCQDQVHMYADRDYGCPRCGEQVRKYVNRCYESLAEDCRKITLNIDPVLKKDSKKEPQGAVGGGEK